MVPSTPLWVRPLVSILKIGSIWQEPARWISIMVDLWLRQNILLEPTLILSQWMKIWNQLTPTLWVPHLLEYPLDSKQNTRVRPVCQFMKMAIIPCHQWLHCLTLIGACVLLTELSTMITNDFYKVLIATGIITIPMNWSDWN